MSQTIFDAVKASGVRALVSAGWGGLGGASIPENVFILGESRRLSPLWSGRELRS